MTIKTTNKSLKTEEKLIFYEERPLVNLFVLYLPKSTYLPYLNNDSKYFEERIHSEIVLFKNNLFQDNLSLIIFQFE